MRGPAAAIAVATFVLATSSGAAAAVWSWSAPASIAPGVTINGISCPTQHLCVAVGTDGTVLTATHPGDGTNGWTSAEIDHAVDHDLVGVSCPSADLCLAAGESGQVFVTTHPAGGSSSWRAQPLDPGGMLTGIVCPTVSLCVASDNDQSIITTTRPDAGPGAWNRAAIATEGDFGCEKDYMEFCPVAVEAAACPSAESCVALDGQGYVLWSGDPAGGESAWSSADVDRVANFGNHDTPASCPSVHLCAFGDGYGQQVFTSDDPTGGGATWVSRDVPMMDGWIACPLTTLCFANEPPSGPNWIAQGPTAPDGPWRESRVDFGSSITGIACPSSTDCIAVDADGHVMTAIVGQAPRSKRRPAITGTAAVGDRLIARSGNWIGSAPITYRYQWQRCVATCRDIRRATGRTLRVTLADRAEHLRVVVTAANQVGHSSRASARTRRVGPATESDRAGARR